MCPCGEAIESTTRTVEECERCNTRRNRMSQRRLRKIDACDMDKFGTLDSSEKTIAILGDRWWPQTAKTARA